MTIFDLFRLDGAVALITGGGGGLGGAMARAFAEAGADVALVGRSQEPLRRVAREVEQRGRRAAVIAADVTEPAAAGRIVAQTVAELGGLSLLVNNAGGLGGPGELDQQLLPALELSEEAWSAQIDLNLNSVWRLTRAAVPQMADGGVILNMSSIKAFQPSGGSGAYAAAKAALNNLTLALSVDLAPRIRVNAIAPGPVPTDSFMAARGVTEADFPKVAKKWGIPLGRVGSPADVAAAALFLASPAGGWITGQTLVVAGGL
jgi:7-alpha-hydroxysteroid dehydrogenase